jgi:hypothetical protein
MAQPPHIEEWQQIDQGFAVILDWSCFYFISYSSVTLAYFCKKVHYLLSIC